MSKKMRRMAAIAMAAAMVTSTPVGASGTNSATTATAPTTTAASANIYYKQNVTTVTVPTALTVAFNPNNLKVSIDGVDNTSDIVSRPVAIVSEATKDKKVSVSFAVTSASDKIKFVDTQTAANTGTDLNVCLQLVAANGGISIPGSGTTSGTAIAVTSATSGSSGTVVYTKSYDGAKLAKATMTPAASGSSGTVTIKNGTAVGFKLGQATYDYETINIDSGASSNEIEGTLTGLGATGYTAFNFTGYLNDGADWYNVGSDATISITPTYTIVDAKDSDTTITGTTGFMGITTVGSGTESAGTGSSSTTTDPNFTAVAKGFTYNTATVQSITSVNMTNTYGTFDAMNTQDESVYNNATSSANEQTGITTVTFDDKYASFYSGTVEATIVYKDKDGQSQTKKLNIEMD